MTRQRMATTLAAAALGALGFVGIQGFTGSALADDVQAAIDSRRALMKEIGAQMKAIYAVVDAKSGDMSDVAQRALAIQADAAKIPTLFPTASSSSDLPDKTHAKAAIWQNMDQFKSSAENLGVQAGRLAEAAKGGDITVVSAEFENTGKACGTCHTNFREKLN